ncbi:MAG: hypothetical protein ACI4RK_07575, partial [Oscillospiraceae bacterium]
MAGRDKQRRKISFYYTQDTIRGSFILGSSGWVARLYFHKYHPKENAKKALQRKLESEYCNLQDSGRKAT